MKKNLLIIFFCALMLSGCGSLEPVEETPAPTPSPEPVVEEEEPELPVGDPVTVDGTILASGSVVSGDVQYVKLAEYMDALGIENNGSEFVWRSESWTVGDGEKALRTIEYYDDLWLPIKEACEKMGVSEYYIEGEPMLYCTAAAGDWTIPEGYPAPVFMYHGVTDDVWGIVDLFVSPSDMEEQLAWLLDNGYDPIWFSDLEHVQDYDKPVILTFDDGYRDNYDNLFPLLQKYQVKATLFIITCSVDTDEMVVTSEQIREMQASGLVDIQSHTYSHPDLSLMSYEDQKENFLRSKEDLVRITGKEPYVLCYPSGTSNQYSQQLVSEYFRFGVKMQYEPYVTGADPTLVYRYYIARSGGTWTLQNMLEWTDYERRT